MHLEFCHDCDPLVLDNYKGGHWFSSLSFDLAYLDISIDTHNTVVVQVSFDDLIWVCSSFSGISYKEGFDFFYPQGNVASCSKKIWKP